MRDKNIILAGLVLISFALIMIFKAGNSLDEVNSPDLSKEYRPNSNLDKEIHLKLGYNALSNYDTDNDGVESLNGVIDINVNKTFFNWKFDAQKLCTRWAVYSIENDIISLLCHGNQMCCSFVNLTASRSRWDEVFYLTYGMHSASQNNFVSAEVLYVDYNTSLKTPYSRIYHSDMQTLPAKFLTEEFQNNTFQDVLANIQKIKQKNKDIGSIAFADRDGNILDFGHNNNIESVTISLLKDGNAPIIVSIKNFNPGEAHWDKSDRISISTSNEELEKQFEKAGVIPNAIISINGIDNLIEDKEYTGALRFSNPKHINNIVYCLNDEIRSCRELGKCSDNKDLECYISNESELSVFVPHFSSIVILDNASIAYEIHSPNNIIALQRGENVNY
jgi:hypothetical protein